MAEPDGFGLNCSAQIVSAHTISRSASLLSIARDGHVYAPPIHRTFNEIERSGGEVSLELQGINRHSTFRGFCSAHDGQVFRKIDSLEPDIDVDFCNRLAYRSVCKELYLKQQLQLREDDLRLVETGRDSDFQRKVRADLQVYNRGMAAAVDELRRYKDSLEEEIGNKERNWNHTVICVNGEMPVLASAPYQPIKSIYGESLQRFEEDGRALENVIFNYIATNRGGAVVLSVSQSDQIAAGFVESIRRLTPEIQIVYLVGFAFEMFENLAVRPTWWEALSPEGRELLNQAASRGANLLSEQDEQAPFNLFGVIEPAIEFAYTQEFYRDETGPSSLS